MASDKYIHYSDGLPNSKPKTSPPQSLLGSVPLGTKMMNKVVDTGLKMAKEAKHEAWKMKRASDHAKGYPLEG